MTSHNPSVRQLAQMLIEARRRGEPIDPIPEELAPSSVAEAEAVDDLVAEISGWPVLGWKIGCTSGYAQELLGAAGPFAGRIYRIVDSGARLTAEDVPANALLEGEFAFTLGAELSSTHGPPGRSEVMAAVADVRPAVEVVGGRYASFVGLDLNLIIADAGANGLLVVGPPVVDVDLDNLHSARATMTVDGEQTGAGTGADVLGHPIDALHWLAGHLAGRGVDLLPGQIVTTGTATQVSTLPSGSSATATFDMVGSVSLSRV